MRGDSCAGVHRDPCDLAVNKLALAGVETRTHVEPQPLDSLGDRAGAADRPRWPVEGGEESVARSVDLRAAGERELAPDQRVVPLEELAPARVPKLDGGGGGIDDVGEED